MTTAQTTQRADVVGTLLTAAIVILALASGYIHTTLGQWYFYLNALGYLTLAILMVLPVGLARRFRWLIRLALLGYALGSIVMWLIFGARFDLAYLDKGIEIVMILLLLVVIYRSDGGPRGVVAHLRGLPAELSSLRGGGR
jgi:hypothetical protein